MLVRLLEVFGQWLVSRLSVLANLDLILEYVDIINYVFIVNKRFVFFLQWT